jgi:hypothetical protein
MKQTGIIILALGIIITLFTGFKFVNKEKVIDIGSFEEKHKKKHNIAWSPEVGIALIVVGGAVLLVRTRSSKLS